jgi:predicted porin
MLDPLYRTALQGRDRGLQSNLHRGAGEEGQGRATNTLRYDSPSWNGLKGGFHYTLDGDENDGEDDNPYGVGLSYENGTTSPTIPAMTTAPGRSVASTP